jgi:hypothetical protein
MTMTKPTQDPPGSEPKTRKVKFHVTQDPPFSLTAPFYHVEPESPEAIAARRRRQTMIDEIDRMDRAMARARDAALMLGLSEHLEICFRKLQLLKQKLYTRNS